MKSHAYYMAKRLEANAKNNSTGSSIHYKRDIKWNLSRSTIDTKKYPRYGGSIISE